jgi:hypothetical protein
MKTIKKNKIGIIIPYFGKLPNYFSFYLKGCEFNTNVVDIHFIHDQDIAFDLPQNFFHHRLSLSDFNKLATLKLGIEIVIKNPYKLCDFKPLYGHVFEDILMDYEFWGYGDIDIVYGDLSKFYSELNLKKYDIFTFREYIISGALTIMKNNSYFKMLYKKNYKINELLISEKYCGFDEAADKIALCRKRKPAFELLHIDNILCWTSIIQQEFYEDRLNLYSKYELIEAISFNNIYMISNGELTMGFDEFAAYHLVTEKKISKFVIPNWKEIPNQFFITPTGFYKKIDFSFFLISHFREIKFKIQNFTKRVCDSINYRLKLKLK